jgi:hypothetical protein
MNPVHLTENEIQDCALGTAESDQIQHLNFCPLCHTKVANYRLILEVMDELPKPSFDFDVEELVMAQLPQPAVRSERWVYIAACFVLALLFVPLWIFRDELAKIAHDVQPVALCLTGLTVVVILPLHVGELYRKHLKKINALISGDLQL